MLRRASPLFPIVASSLKPVVHPPHRSPPPSAPPHPAFSHAPGASSSALHELDVRHRRQPVVPRHQPTRPRRGLAHRLARRRDDGRRALQGELRLAGATNAPLERPPPSCGMPRAPSACTHICRRERHDAAASGLVVGAHLTTVTCFLHLTVACRMYLSIVFCTFSTVVCFSRLTVALVSARRASDRRVCSRV